MKIRSSHLTIISILLFLSYLLSACALQNQIFSQADLENAYNSAVKDAEKAEQHEIYKNLVAIVPSNSDLVWKRNNDQNTYLLVVTWTDYDGYDDKVGQSVILSRDVWTTTVPELMNFCKKLKRNKTLKLEQLLGLPPNAGKTKFVEMWVRPSDLFRPSADPEISDCEAEIDFPMSNKFVKVSDDYINWFNELKKNSYGKRGYPWTRLGYTYDWGKDGNHIGLSEFVIIKGSTVEINSSSSTLQYCR